MIRSTLASLRFKYFPTSHQRLVKRFKRDCLHNDLRFDYPLDSSSIVLDIGGFEGEWSNRMLDLYGCRIYVFEPVVEFSKALATRFAGRDRVEVCPFGLAGSTEVRRFSIEGDGSSAFRKSKTMCTVQVVDVVDWVRDAGIEVVHLAKINIEGGEYELLDRLIASGYISRFQDLQVQFHRLSRRSVWDVARLRERLRATHHTTYQYDFVWENWRLHPTATVS